MPGVYHYLGFTLDRQEKYEEAIAAYEKAIQLNPQYADAYYNLVNTLDEIEKYEEAMAAYQKAIQLNPQYASAYNNLGNTLDEIEKYEEAIAAYQKAIQLNPQGCRCLQQSGCYFSKSRKITRRRSPPYEKALELPDNKTTFPTTPHSQAHNNLGRLLQSQGDLESAIINFKRATQRSIPTTHLPATTWKKRNDN